MTLQKCNWCSKYFEGGDGWHCERCDKGACTECTEKHLESYEVGNNQEKVYCEPCVDELEVEASYANYEPHSDPDHGEEPSIDEVNNVP